MKSFAHTFQDVFFKKEAKFDAFYIYSYNSTNAYLWVIKVYPIGCGMVLSFDWFEEASMNQPSYGYFGHVVQEFFLTSMIT